MTVAELIERLRALPQDAIVCVDYDGLFYEATRVQLHNNLDAGSSIDKTDHVVPVAVMVE